MIQNEFAEKAVQVLQGNPIVEGLAVGGSWISGELDEFSDLDLVLVTTEKISNDLSKMKEIAAQLGSLLSAFTGEHVGEPRLLICLFNNPLLHVDIKFVTLEEFSQRIETPVLLLDKKGLLAASLKNSEALFPYPDYQWIEDRFWTWIHYALVKIGRGEYLEAFDFLSSLRMMVLGPLLHIKHASLPRGVRKLESTLNEVDFYSLQNTLPTYDRNSLLSCLRNAVELYRNLRSTLYDNSVQVQEKTEEVVLDYFRLIENKK